jgi:metal-dependent amidase/aminoacylase/carboxypeptidase family protein
MLHDHDLAALFKNNAEMLGRSFPELALPAERAVVSTDMGNVSQLMPSIHPMIGISSFPASNHQKEFAAQCVTESADKAVYDGALAMAWTAIDCARQTSIRDRLLSRTAPK